MRVATLRYQLQSTHEWDDEVIERLRREMERPPVDADTMVHRLQREIGT